MITKTSLFHSESEAGRVVVPIFGATNSFFEKHAAASLMPEVASYIAGLRPVATSQYVLVNAMGASEFYGSNVNGDAFPEASLIHKPDGWQNNPVIDKVTSASWSYGFPTFYNAHPFAHHRNKDPGLAFGEVELATWNPHMRRVELVTRLDYDKCQKFGGTGVWDKLKAGGYPDVSMGSKVPFDTCFPAGTLVRTATGQRAIQNIQVGDQVLSHTGASRRVSQTMSRTAEGLVALTVSGLPRIEATDNHPFLVLRRAAARTCKGSANGARLRHSFKGDAATCHRCGKQPAFELVWAAAETVTPGDYLAVPATTVGVEIPVSPAKARLLGYYLGDGYVVRQRTGKKKDGDHRDMGVGFSVGTSEEAHLQRLLATLMEVGTINEPCVYDAGAGRAALIVNVYDQALAVWVQESGGRTSQGKYLAPEDFQWPLEAKLELVAGYIDTDGSFDEKGQIRIASVNRGLLLDVQRLLLTAGVTATVCFAGTSTGYTEAGSPFWYLVLSGFQAQKFLGRSTKVRELSFAWESPQSFFWEGYWLTPVRAVEELEGQVEVFNLSVEVDESYVAEGRAVHNCSICLDWDRYKAALATFDPKRHKSPGEAVLEVHKKSPIRGVSITRKDYCEHTLKNMNKILPDGRKVFVYNDFPNFFDISFVFVGADRTAKTMLFIFSGGKQLKLETPVEAPVAAPNEKTAAVATFEQLAEAVGEKKGEIEKERVPSNLADKAVPALTRNESDIPSSTLDGLAALPLGGVLSTLGGLGMVMRPREFQRIVLVRVGKRDLADQLESFGEVFPRTSESLPVSLGPEQFLSGLLPTLMPLLSMRSGLGPVVEQRVIILAGSPGTSAAPEKPATETSKEASALLQGIGQLYNGYRSSLLDFVPYAQELLDGSGYLDARLAKIAAAPVEDVFTPLAAHYFKSAFLDEVGDS